MLSSSAAVLDRPASPALPGPLALDPLPLDSLAPVSSTPTLAAILFPDFSLSSVPSDSQDAEAPAAAPFTITDISSASWAAAKVLEAQARIAQRAELATAFIDKITSWLSSSNKADEDTASYLSMLLKPFIESELSRTHSRSRTLHLLTASASLRKSPDHVSVLDEASAMAFLQAHYPSAIITKKTISLSTVRSLILSKATPIPGIEASLGSDTLHLKPRS